MKETNNFEKHAILKDKIGVLSSIMEEGNITLEE